jgi:hypothetical protein
MSAITKAERARLPLAVFAQPEIRLLPILDQEDVYNAIRRFVLVRDNREQVRARIIALARSQGLRLPDSWEKTMSNNPDTDAANEADAREFGRKLARHGNGEHRGMAVESNEGDHEDEDEGTREAREDARRLANRMNRQQKANEDARKPGEKERS